MVLGSAGIGCSFDVSSLLGLAVVVAGAAVVLAMSAEGLVIELFEILLVFSARGYGPNPTGQRPRYSDRDE